MIVLVAAAIAGYPPSVALLAIPLLVVVMVAAALGVSSALSAVNVRYRDVRYVVPFAIQLWLFATPIAYPSRSCTSRGARCRRSTRWSAWSKASAGRCCERDRPLDDDRVSAGSAVLLLVGGIAYFDRVERSFADLV